eukprot:8533692-Pyramimonas_sp.AAC.1
MGEGGKASGKEAAPSKARLLHLQTGPAPPEKQPLTFVHASGNARQCRAPRTPRGPPTCDPLTPGR